MGKSFRLPNSFGSIYKLSGNRRRPWAIAKTFGWTDKGKQVKKIIGYAETKKDAMQLLMEYNKNPLSSVELLNISFKDAFERWITYADDLSEANKKIYQSVFDNHCVLLYKIKILDLRTVDIQNAIDMCIKGYNTKRYIKLIASQVFKYCTIQLDMTLSKNFSIGLKIGDKPKSELHKPFTKNEIKILWENIAIQWADTILLTIYTGLRPSELLKIEKDKVFIKERYMVGGIKTKAGIDRLIPIHEDIVPIVERMIKTNNNYLIEKEGKRVNYRYYLDKYIEVMNMLNMNHKPHDGRHTLATELDNVGANDVCIKIILGHAIDDITKGVYTHKELQQLIDTINMIKIC